MRGNLGRPTGEVLRANKIPVRFLRRLELPLDLEEKIFVPVSAPLRRILVFGNKFLACLDINKLRGKRALRLGAVKEPQLFDLRIRLGINLVSIENGIVVIPLPLPELSDPVCSDQYHDEPLRNRWNRTRASP